MPRMHLKKGDYTSCNSDSANFLVAKGFIPLKSLSTASTVAGGNSTTVTATAMTTLTLPKVATTERGDECGHNSVVSGTGAVATCFFLIGLLMYLVAFASHDWLGLEQGTTISLWRKCHRDFVIDVWSCQPWDKSPGK
ncbi:hypothetical protein ElyMa_001865400 [Elysia marginata]|uniref:Uncharacterized protein n=1 Tax=Elysia marginata TaxID=1093978 RepID=A0AAV4ENV2_9GAST|nr:hypothetical protein ElyMa_001865400 [Elysia marginata]